MRRQLGPLVQSLRSSLWEMTPRDHRQSDREFRRRQIVSAVVVVLGAGVLGFSLSIPPEDNVKFSVATLVLAGVWTAGAFASGPLHLGRIGRPSEPDLMAPRPVVQPLLIGALLAIVFVFGAFVVREFPWLDAQVSKVLAHTGQGSAVVLLVVTLVTGNVMLGFAAILLGVVVGLQRRASGGILAPILTHLVWSVAMLYALPAIIL